MAAIATATIKIGTRRPRRARFVHNVVAHPLLALWPTVGQWLHDRTEP